MVGFQDDALGCCPRSREVQGRLARQRFGIRWNRERLIEPAQIQLRPGMCAGFKAGTGNGHNLVNNTSEDVVYLEVGDRSSGDNLSYPDDDLPFVPM